MIKKCDNENNRTEVMEYIGDDYGKCIYIYIDLKEYGLQNPNFNVWYQSNGGNITAVITEYYKGIQLYSKNNDINAKEVAEFIADKSPHIILGMKAVVDKVKPFLPEYREEVGNVGQLQEIRCNINNHAYSADICELEDIVSVIAEDEGIGKAYGFDSLYAQYKERKETGFGRNFVLRNEQNGEMICHAGTYAELEEIAVIGGVLSAPKYRGKGYSKGVLAALCRELLSEGKKIFSYYYIPSAIKMHEGVGFTILGQWAKLVK